MSKRPVPLDDAQTSQDDFEAEVLEALRGTRAFQIMMGMILEEKKLAEQASQNNEAATDGGPPPASPKKNERILKSVQQSFEVALGEVTKARINDIKFEESLKAQLDKIYPGSRVMKIEALGKKIDSIEGESADNVETSPSITRGKKSGINPHKVALLVDADGCERLIHVKQVGSPLVLQSRFCEVFVYRLLSLLGYGPETHAMFLANQAHPLFTVTEDIVSRKHAAHRTDPDYQAGDYSFDVMSGIKEKVKNRTDVGEEGLEASEASAKESAEKIHFRDMLFDDPKEQKRFLELDLISAILGLRDVKHNWGNVGLRQKKVGSAQSITTKTTPAIVDFALIGPGDDHLETTEQILSQIPSSSPSQSSSVTRQLLGNYVAYKLTPDVLDVVEERLERGRTDKKGNHKPGFMEAVGLAFNYTKDFFEDLERKSLIPSKGPSSPNNASSPLRSSQTQKETPTPSSPTKSSVLSDSISRVRYKGYEFEPVERYRDQIVGNYQRFQEQCRARKASAVR